MERTKGKKKKTGYKLKCPRCGKEINRLELAFSRSSTKGEITNYPEPIDLDAPYDEMILVCPECNHTIFSGYKNHDELLEGLKHEVCNFFSEKLC